MTKHDAQFGFTLLEMMIVIAIIGLLMTLSIPSYQRYTQRAKFTEVTQAVLPYKLGVTLCAYQQGDLSACSTDGPHIPEIFKCKDKKTGYIRSIQVEPEGKIVATAQNIKLDKKVAFTYTLKPSLQSNGTCQWMIDTSSPDSCKHYHLC